MEPCSAGDAYQVQSKVGKTGTYQKPNVAGAGPATPASILRWRKCESTTRRKATCEGRSNSRQCCYGDGLGGLVLPEWTSRLLGWRRLAHRFNLTAIDKGGNLGPCG